VITAVAGYFVILRGRSFYVGDRIAMGGVRGDVVSLGYVHTTIMEMCQPPPVQSAEPAMLVEARQYTGRMVTVTNDKVFDQPIYNFTRAFPFIWEELHLPIGYGADRARAERILLDAARRHTSEIAEAGRGALEGLERRDYLRPADLDPCVYLRLTDNGIDLTVRFVAREHGVRALKDAMSRDILSDLEEAGIEVASSTYEIVGLPPHPPHPSRPHARRADRLRAPHGPTRMTHRSRYPPRSAVRAFRVRRTAALPAGRLIHPVAFGRLRPSVEAPAVRGTQPGWPSIRGRRGAAERADSRAGIRKTDEAALVIFRAMKLAHDTMMERFYARDRSADGQFLTGVLTTGIYCLPSCTAQKPKPENVRFFATEDDAREAGLRPCRRCRPGDFYRRYDPDLHLLDTLAAEARKRPAAFPDVESLVSGSGVGATKLHALFRRHWHATPAAFLSRERVAAAQRLLESDAPTAAEVAFAVGYESLSAFHDHFRRLTGLTPGEYRRLGRDTSFTIALPAGFLASYTLRMLGRDVESVTERAAGCEVAKGVTLLGRPAVLRLDLSSAVARCRVDADGPLSVDEMRAAHRMAVRLLGLGADPEPFERRIAADPELERLTHGRAGLRVPLTSTVFEGLMWSIVGQQVNLAFAYELRRTLALLAGRDAVDGLLAHPTPEAVAALDYADLTSRRYSRRKAEYVIDTARAVASGALAAEELPARRATSVEAELLALRGFGPWSSAYVMMRACGFGDCVPVGDTGLTSALQRFFALDARPGPDETLARMEAFAPFRTLATHHLWMTLGDPA
jgi:AraC family transcriptional regulator of adaptative response / DNA-3-methyladenine glycosylase II